MQEPSTNIDIFQEVSKIGQIISDLKHVNDQLIQD
jgi:hypothetical protein